MRRQQRPMEMELGCRCLGPDGRAEVRTEIIGEVIAKVITKVRAEIRAEVI